MTKKITKRALLVSVLSLFVCFTMLIGTTYAWFTDSVTSTGNIIKTGTLDVTLEYSKEAPAGKDDALWTDASTGAIFSYDNWEPGYVQVRYVKIENEGTLDLKFVLNIIPNANATDVDLADVIEVYMVGGANTVDRANLTTDSAAYKGTLASLIADEDGAAYGTLTDGEFAIYTIALKMSESAGNEYQNKSVGGGFAVQLLATQLASEEDDIDDQYDKDAEYINISAPVAVPDNATASMTLVGKDVTVDIPAAVVNNLPAEVTSIAVKYTAPQVDATTNTVSFAAVDLVDQNGNVIDLTNNTTPVNVVLPAQTALAGKDVVVMHDGVIVASTTVGADGAISYTANHFCEVTVVTATKVGTAAELVDAVAKGGNIQLAADITMSDKLNITADTVIFGMGKTLTYTGSDRAITADNSGVEVDLTINDLTVNCASSSCQRGINYNDSGKLTLDNVIVTGENVTYALNLPSSSDDAIVVINDCALTGNIALNVWGENATITVNNTVLTSVDKAVAENYTAIALNNDGSTNAANGTVIYINGGEIVAEDEKGEPSTAVRNDTKTGKINLSDETKVVGEIRSAVAFIMYKDANGEYMDNFYASFSLQRAIEKASESDNAVIVLAQNIVLDESITIDGTVNLDLNGKTLHFTNTTTNTHNFFIDVNGGTLNAYNGTISMSHTGANMGWNGATSVINVTAGGVLNLENVTVKNNGGTDMNFAVHLNNWGEVTLNADNCVFDAPYCGVRVFNSGPDMNNVTIENSTLKGGNRAFWVHNYASEDFGGKVYSSAAAAYDKAVVDARMNFDIFDNNNTFEISGTATSPIRYGFNSTVYYNAEGKQLVTATTLAEVMAYAKNGNVIIDAQGANLGDFNYNGKFGNGTVLKNAKFTYVYGASVDGVATFENCEFVSDHSYSANFSDGSYTGKVIFNNCVFDGWSSFGDAITSVEMNNCTFDWNNPYSMLRFYQDAQLNNCKFVAIDGIDTNKTGTVVELNNCTGIEGKIYNNTEDGVVKVGTWIVDGVVLTDVPAW